MSESSNSSTVLGLYVDRVPSPVRPFGEQTRMFEEMSSMSQSFGVTVVVLTPGDVFQRQASVFDDETKVWKRCGNVVPDVVLRRSGAFRSGKRGQAEMELRQLQMQGKLHTLPRNSSNKWTLYQLLSNTEQLRDNLPRTTLCLSGRDLYQAVQARGDVYLKPPGGAQGVSIYHLKRSGSVVQASWERRVVPRLTERLTNTFQPQTRVMEQAIQSEQQLELFWRGLKLKRAIVQDTVSLPKKDGAPFDFRWLVHSSDQPKILARVARIGQPEAITTNIHTGGTAVAAQTVIDEVFGKAKRQRYVTEMDRIAKQVVEALAKRYGAFAEVGIDMALTPDGQVYIFEMNPTPGRRMLRALGPGVRRLSLESLLEYASRATMRRA